VTGHYFPLDKTPYTKYQLQQQTKRTLRFIKSAKPGEICNLIFHLSHTSESNITSTDKATTEMQRLQAEFKIAKDIKED